MVLKKGGGTLGMVLSRLKRPCTWFDRCGLEEDMRCGMDAIYLDSALSRVVILLSTDPFLDRKTRVSAAPWPPNTCRTHALEAAPVTCHHRFCFLIFISFLSFLLSFFLSFFLTFSHFFLSFIHSFIHSFFLSFFLSFSLSFFLSLFLSFFLSVSRSFSFSFNCWEKGHVCQFEFELLLCTWL